MTKRDPNNPALKLYIGQYAGAGRCSRPALEADSPV